MKIPTPCVLVCVFSLMSSGCWLSRQGTLEIHTLDHFYTIDPAEKDNALANHGYVDDGIPVAGFVFPEAQLFPSETVPLHRLYHSQNGDHFYTIDAAEKSNAITTHGYTDEGIEAHVFATPESGTAPFFRLWKPVAQGGDHFYTTDVVEKNTAISTHGYTDEGMEGRIYTSQVPGTVPLFRLYRPEQ